MLFLGRAGRAPKGEGGAQGLRCSGDQLEFASGGKDFGSRSVESSGSFVAGRRAAHKCCVTEKPRSLRSHRHISGLQATDAGDAGDGSAEVMAMALQGGNHRKFLQGRSPTPSSLLQLLPVAATQHLVGKVMLLH